MTPTDIADLIAELLDIDDFAPDDNFFEMGGTSIMALRLLAEVERRWGATLSLIDVVHHPTPTGMVSAAASATPAGDGAP